MCVWYTFNAQYVLYKRFYKVIFDHTIQEVKGILVTNQDGDRTVVRGQNCNTFSVYNTFLTNIFWHNFDRDSSNAGDSIMVTVWKCCCQNHYVGDFLNVNNRSPASKICQNILSKLSPTKTVFNIRHWHRCSWRILETKCVGYSFLISATYLIHSKITNIMNKSETKRFGHQHLKSVNIIKSPT